MAVGLEGVQDSSAVFELRGSYLFLAFAAKGHGAEYDGKGGFGRHLAVLNVRMETGLEK